MSEKSPIKVSVCVVTYNQERYIGKCLESLVKQDTDFLFEIIVGEDGSTDDTRIVVEKFAENYPDLIVKNFHEKNVGAVNNIISTYRLAKGRYICHMDGDDLALPGKLAEQVESLDNNPGCVICSHDMKVIDEAGAVKRDGFSNQGSGVFGIEALYSHLPFFAHSSKMFVNDLYRPFWETLGSKSLDIEVHAQQLNYGNIIHISKVLGAYRRHVGVSSSGNDSSRLTIEAIDRVFADALDNNRMEKKLVFYYHALALFRQAYKRAIIGDSISARQYIKRSNELAFISVSQRLYFYLSYFPTLMCALSKVRARLRGFDM